MLVKMAGAIAFVITASTSLSTAPSQVFRVDAELVEIHAVVVDKAGNTVAGLAANDFEVLEDGRPLRVQHLSFVDLPLPESRPATAPTAGSSAIDSTSDNHAPLGRLYVIVLDGFHIDAMRTGVVRKLARLFIDTAIGPADSAAVINVGLPDESQGFTSNKRLLLDAVDKLIGRKARSAFLTRQEAASRLPSGMGRTPEDTDAGIRANQARTSLEVIRNLCRSLEAVSGRRKSLVLFSEGLDINTGDLIGEDARPSAGGRGLLHETAKIATFILDAEREMLLAAMRANATIYTVDPRGNTVGADVDIESVAVGMREIAEEVRRGQGTLRTFADETGGLAVVNTNDLGTGLQRISQANSAYYVLGCVPFEGRRNAFRRLSVKVKREGLQISARRAYFVPAAAAATATGKPAKVGGREFSLDMKRLLESELPSGGLGLRVAGGPLRKAGKNVEVALVLEIDGGQLSFQEQDGTLSTTIEIGVLAVSAAGAIVNATRQLGNLRLPAADRHALARGVGHVLELTLPAGRYQVRVAARESAGGRSGMVLHDVDTSGANRGELAIGTILLSVGSASRIPTSGSIASLAGLFADVPTASREFSRADRITALTNVMIQGNQCVPSLTGSVRSDAGAELIRLQPTMLRIGSDGGNHGPYSFLVPMSQLSVGRYELVLDASCGGERSSRAVMFRVT